MTHLFSSSSLLRLAALALAAAPLLASCKKDDTDAQNAALQEQAIAAYRATRAADSLTIIKYVADSSFKNVERRASGVVVVHKVSVATTVPLAQPGQSLTTYYKGYTIPANKLFDASATDPTTGLRKPFSFTLRVDQVISGWHEGFASLRKGEKAILLIPSYQAYGPSGNGPIPPNAPLRFDVELADVK
ncbi:FKBP-type peptidyl-prolyl cis-trans isomerase [Hymenobacter sp. GOD-10R]|uniref:FKBP-type peptidyl-prolyl cis-trans isomerase n=1 Tax=Hymenobacter sp. GOD-10R TaxID=3093922 RepID=UPI002D7A1531|nr:FKBP-type peptidyl-prolyl cis-trans isomerase [Hymenobacter sp. GOD-10R]WRQ28033.1 FKBP-type peptidyl-prolyl cis-trans isomerase [Hymenobacter sp. GOD-10R]